MTHLITEQSSALTGDIDIIGASNGAAMLQAVDEELFYNFCGGGLLSATALKQIEELCSRLKGQQLKTLMFVGAGTSGRLCRQAAVHLSGRPQMSDIVIHGVMAGGTQALWKALPLSEDQSERGSQDMQRVASKIETTKAALIAVSCGFSARYAEGAMSAGRREGVSCAAYIGFNRVETSRINLFQDQENPPHVLAPILGPEAVAGSVRMKGGSATLILLLALARSSTGHEHSRSGVLKQLQHHEQSVLSLRSLNTGIGLLATAAAKSIRNGGRIIIFGDSIYGALGVFDAAECVPTFGAKQGEYSSYLADGWQPLRCPNGTDRDELLTDGLSASTFMRNHADTLCEDDTVMIITQEGYAGFDEACDTLRAAGISPWKISVSSTSINISERDAVFGSRCIRDEDARLVAARCVLSRISTLAYAEAGKLYGNLMIDLRITNHKLFRRAAAIVTDLAKTSYSAACDTIMRIAEIDCVAEQPSEEELDLAVERLSGVRRVVPTALFLLLNPEATRIQAEIALDSEPVLRRAIEALARKVS